MGDRLVEQSRDSVPVERTPEDQPLFRPQVLVARQSQWLGTVLFAPSISHRLFALFATVSMSAILALLFLSDYTRKERISGWLVPEQGLVRVLAPQPGVISELSVQDGDTVDIGAPLLTLSTEVESVTLGATQVEIALRQQSRRESLIAERDVHNRLLEEELDGLRKRIGALQAQEISLGQEIALQRAKAKLATGTAERLEGLRDQGLIGAPAFELAEDNRLDQSLRLQGLERQKTAAAQERLVLEAELRAMPLRTEARLAELDRSISVLEQDMAMTQAQRRIVITAAQAGTVTGLRAEFGSSVSTSVPLVSIMPAGSKLIAELFVPSSAIGFIREGQSVLLRYRAFPYQKFGHHDGTLRSVSRSTVSPSELGSRLSGLTTLFSGNEAVYVVRVELERQDITAYGAAVPLQSGMLLEADIVIETRRLIDWVFDPLYTLTGKLRA